MRGEEKVEPGGRWCVSEAREVRGGKACVGKVGLCVVVILAGLAANGCKLFMVLVMVLMWWWGWCVTGLPLSRGWVAKLKLPV